MALIGGCCHGRKIGTAEITLKRFDDPLELLSLPDLGMKSAE